MSAEKELQVVIDYTNHRGERRERTITPSRILFGHNTWHENDQWLLMGWDKEKGAVRSFALKDVHSWRPA
jgi:predicted DNA-binding transcriptional regulator YafY